MPSARDQLRLCVLGPLVGRNAGYVTTQGEALVDWLRSEGRPVVAASSHRNRYARLVDILLTLLRHRHRIDVILVQGYSGANFVVVDAATALARRLGHRIVVCLRGGATPTFMARFPSWTCRVLRRADALVAPSRYLADAVGAYGFRVRVIPNVIAIEQYPFRVRGSVGPRLFWMRSFHPVYNPLMAIRVLARVRERFPDATLVMAGQDKGMERDARQLAARLGVAPAVHFAGFLDAQGKRWAAEVSDILINTNRIDNTPVAVIEAAAMGLPIVTTNVGGISDLLSHNESALFVANESDQGMADAVIRLVCDPALGRRLSLGGRKLAESFTWHHVSGAWAELFAEFSNSDRRLTHA